MSRLTRTAINELLDRYDLSPSRALGQNFLCEPATVDKIVRLADVGEDDRVVEIGPGLGSLTLALAETGAQVVAVELDRHLMAPLRDVLAATDVDLVEADARTVDWQLVLGPGDDHWTVVANLPYNVATPLILDLLGREPRFTQWLVMVQREVGERLAAEPGSRAAGIPSVIRSYWAEAVVVGRVPPQVFLPRPRVESVLVRLERHEQPPVEVDFDELSTLVRAGFGQRRKMVRRSLAAHLGEDQIRRAGVDPTVRAEQLDLAAWARLANVDQS